MAQHKIRAKPKKKASRWAKGQSSSSNPSCKKHRDAAKARLLQTGMFGVEQARKSGDRDDRAWPAKLTAESLLRHDALMANGQAAQPDQDDDAMTSKTFDTFATDWTQCTNLSFGRLIHRFSSKNAHHREMLAILAAVTEVIKSRGGKETNTEYLAALLSSLRVTDTAQGLSAALTLLSMVIKTVPQNALRVMFVDISQVFLQLLAQHGASENVSLVRALIGCLSVLVRAQPLAAWSGDSDVFKILDSMLSFCNHTKPKIRKSGQHAVCAVLKASCFMLDPAAPDLHPAAARVAKFIIKGIEAASGNSASKEALHYLLMLKEVLGVFPRPQVKACCEAILKMATLGHAITVSCCMQALYGLFSSRPAVTCLSPDMNGRLITALYDFCPSVNDLQPFIAWLTVQQEAVLNLGQLDADMAWAHLPRFFSVATQGWSGDRAEVATASTTALKAVANQTIRDHVERFASSPEHRKHFQCAFGHVESGLKYQCHAAWSQVLHLLSVMFEVSGAYFSEVMGSCLSSMAHLRGSVNFSLINELDFAMGKAIRFMGPEVVLRHVPLQITGKELTYDFPRSWLLPVLRENVQNTRLSFFKSHFLPLAKACRERADQALASGDKVLFKTYDLLVSQVWALLPGFCRGTVDLKEGFKDVARILGEQLQQRKELRLDILSSLRQLIMNSGPDPDGRTELARYAKNFLPILFNLFTTVPVGAEEAGQRLAVLETAKLYFTLADSDLLIAMFDKAFAMMQAQPSPDDSQFFEKAVMDLLQGLLPHVDSSRLAKMFDLAVHNMSSKDHRKQKRSYRILEKIFRCSSASSQEFVRQHLPQIQDLLISSLSQCSPPSQAARISCLLNIVQQLKATDVAAADTATKFVYSLVPEAILCVKAINSKARAAAYTLLVAIGEALQRWHPDQQEGDTMKAYLSVLLAGLAGGPKMVSCTLLAITRLFYEFRQMFGPSLVMTLLDNVCLLVSTTAREPVGASLSFLKVFVVVQPVLESTRHLEKVVQALCRMTDDCKRHFRLKCRYLFDRMVRKFGFDLVASFVPKEDAIMHKRLRNIRKDQTRKQAQDKTKADDADSDEEAEQHSFHLAGRPKSIEDILADSDLDLDDDEGKPRKASLKKKGPATFISEDASEAVLDLLDPSASQFVSSTRPKSADSANKRASRNGFAVAPDGRLIIRDEDEEDEGSDAGGADDAGLGAKKLKHKMSHDSDSDADNFESLVASGKKRRTGSSSVGTHFSMKSRQAPDSGMKYRTGGSGIHRALNGEEYQSKKAKGDVKRKDKPDPYAYVPLQKSSLNRRKRAKREGQFKNLVAATKTGSRKGSAGKSLANKLHKIKLE